MDGGRFRKPRLERLIVRVNAAQCVTGPASISFGRLRRTHHRKHAGSFAISVSGGRRFLFKNNILVADRADHGAVCVTILLQKSVEAHDAATAYRDPNFFRIFWAHTPLSAFKWAKYIPERRCPRILIWLGRVLIIGAKHSPWIRR